MLAFLALALVAAAGCSAPRVTLFPSQADPLREFTLEGKAAAKILVIPIRGLITDQPQEGFIRTQPSVLQETVSHLHRAAEDKSVKAVVLQIDSPGGR